jgi:hypothetical protein
MMAPPDPSLVMADVYCWFVAVQTEVFTVGSPDHCGSAEERRRK